MYHGPAHPSARTTSRLVTEKFVWPSMRKDVALWARTCIPCQQAKVHRHTKSPLQQFPIPDERFQHVHLDLVGPLPPSRGQRYCLTMIDRFSRWPEAVPLADCIAEVVAEAFVNQWIARYGSPATITTDQGRQFEASLMTSLANLTGTQRSRSTAYRPQTNGILERWHRTLKAAITCHHTEQWVDVLPIVLLGLRTAYKADLKASPAEMLYGTTLRLPGEFFVNATPTCKANPAVFCENLRECMRRLRPTPTASHVQNATFVHPDLATCTHVFLRDDRVRRPLQPPFTGPHEIIERRGKVYTIRLKGQPYKVSVDRLKPAFQLQTDDDATPSTATHTVSRSGRIIRQPVRFQLS